MARDAVQHPVVHETASPQRRVTWPQVSVVLGLKKPVLEFHIGHSLAVLSSSEFFFFYIRVTMLISLTGSWSHRARELVGKTTLCWTFMLLKSSEKKAWRQRMIPQNITTIRTPVGATVCDCPHVGVFQEVSLPVRYQEYLWQPFL